MGGSSAMAAHKLTPDAGEGGSGEETRDNFPIDFPLSSCLSRESTPFRSLPGLPSVPEMMSKFRPSFLPLLQTLYSAHTFTTNVYAIDVLLTLTQIDVHLGEEERRIFVCAYEDILSHLMVKVESMRFMILKSFLLFRLLRAMACACRALQQFLCNRFKVRRGGGRGHRSSSCSTRRRGRWRKKKKERSQMENQRKKDCQKRRSISSISSSSSSNHDRGSDDNRKWRNKWPESFEEKKEVPTLVRRKEMKNKGKKAMRRKRSDDKNYTHHPPPPSHCVWASPSSTSSCCGSFPDVEDPFVDTSGDEETREYSQRSGTGPHSIRVTPHGLPSSSFTPFLSSPDNEMWMKDTAEQDSQGVAGEEEKEEEEDESRVVNEALPRPYDNHNSDRGKEEDTHGPHMRSAKNPRVGSNHTLLHLPKVERGFKKKSITEQWIREVSSSESDGSEAREDESTAQEAPHARRRVTAVLSTVCFPDGREKSIPSVDSLPVPVLPLEKGEKEDGGKKRWKESTRRTLPARVTSPATTTTTIPLSTRDSDPVERIETFPSSSSCSVTSGAPSTSLNTPPPLVFSSFSSAPSSSSSSSSFRLRHFNDELNNGNNFLPGFHTERYPSDLWNALFSFSQGTSWSWRDAMLLNRLFRPSFDPETCTKRRRAQRRRRIIRRQGGQVSTQAPPSYATHHRIVRDEVNCAGSVFSSSLSSSSSSFSSFSSLSISRGALSLPTSSSRSTSIPMQQQEDQEYTATTTEKQKWESLFPHPERNSKTKKRKSEDWRNRNDRPSSPSSPPPRQHSTCSTRIKMRMNTSESWSSLPSKMSSITTVYEENVETRDEKQKMKGTVEEGKVSKNKKEREDGVAEQAEEKVKQEQQEQDEQEEGRLEKDSELFVEDFKRTPREEVFTNPFSFSSLHTSSLSTGKANFRSPMTCSSISSTTKNNSNSSTSSNTTRNRHPHRYSHHEDENRVMKKNELHTHFWIGLSSTVSLLQHALLRETLFFTEHTNPLGGGSESDEMDAVDEDKQQCCSAETTTTSSSWSSSTSSSSLERRYRGSSSSTPLPPLPSSSFNSSGVGKVKADGEFGLNRGCEWPTTDIFAASLPSVPQQRDHCCNHDSDNDDGPHLSRHGLANSHLGQKLRRGTAISEKKNDNKQHHHHKSKQTAPKTQSRSRQKKRKDPYYYCSSSSPLASSSCCCCPFPLPTLEMEKEVQEMIAQWKPLLHSLPSLPSCTELYEHLRIYLPSLPLDGFRRAWERIFRLSPKIIHRCFRRSKEEERRGVDAGDADGTSPRWAKHATHHRGNVRENKRYEEKSSTVYTSRVLTRLQREGMENEKGVNVDEKEREERGKRGSSRRTSAPLLTGDADVSGTASPNSATGNVVPFGELPGGISSSSSSTSSTLRSFQREKECIKKKEQQMYNEVEGEDKPQEERKGYNKNKKIRDEVKNSGEMMIIPKITGEVEEQIEGKKKVTEEKEIEEEKEDEEEDDPLKGIPLNPNDTSEEGLMLAWWASEEVEEKNMVRATLQDWTRGGKSSSEGGTSGTEKHLPATTNFNTHANSPTPYPPHSTAMGFPSYDASSLSSGGVEGFLLRGMKMSMNDGRREKKGRETNKKGKKHGKGMEKEAENKDESAGSGGWDCTEEKTDEEKVALKRIKKSWYDRKGGEEHPTTGNHEKEEEEEEALDSNEGEQYVIWNMALYVLLESMLRRFEKEDPHERDKGEEVEAESNNHSPSNTTTSGKTNTKNQTPMNETSTEIQTKPVEEKNMEKEIQFEEIEKDVPVRNEPISDTPPRLPPLTREKIPKEQERNDDNKEEEEEGRGECRVGMVKRERTKANRFDKKQKGDKSRKKTAREKQQVDALVPWGSVLIDMHEQLNRLALEVWNGMKPLEHLQQQLLSEVVLLTYRVVATLVHWLIPAAASTDRRSALFYRLWLCDVYRHLHPLSLLPLLNQLKKPIFWSIANANQLQETECSFFPRPMTSYNNHNNSSSSIEIVREKETHHHQESEKIKHQQEDENRVTSAAEGTREEERKDQQDNEETEQEEINRKISQGRKKRKGKVDGEPFLSSPSLPSISPVMTPQLPSPPLTRTPQGNCATGRQHQEHEGATLPASVHTSTLLLSSSASSSSSCFCASSCSSSSSCGGIVPLVYSPTPTPSSSTRPYPHPHHLTSSSLSMLTQEIIRPTSTTSSFASSLTKSVKRENKGMGRGRGRGRGRDVSSFAHPGHRGSNSNNQYNSNGSGSIDYHINDNNNNNSSSESSGQMKYTSMLPPPPLRMTGNGNGEGSENKEERDFGISRQGKNESLPCTEVDSTSIQHHRRDGRRRREEVQKKVMEFHKKTNTKNDGTEGEKESASKTSKAVPMNTHIMRKGSRSSTSGKKSQNESRRSSLSRVSVLNTPITSIKSQNSGKDCIPSSSSSSSSIKNSSQFIKEATSLQSSSTPGNYIGADNVRTTLEMEETALSLRDHERNQVHYHQPHDKVEEGDAKNEQGTLRTPSIPPLLLPLRASRSRRAIPAAAEDEAETEAVGPSENELKGLFPSSSCGGGSSSSPTTELSFSSSSSSSSYSSLPPSSDHVVLHTTSPTTAIEVSPTSTPLLPAIEKIEERTLLGNDAMEGEGGRGDWHSSILASILEDRNISSLPPQDTSQLLPHRWYYCHHHLHHHCRPNLSLSSVPMDVLSSSPSPYPPSPFPSRHASNQLLSSSLSPIEIPNTPIHRESSIRNLISRNHLHHKEEKEEKNDASCLGPTTPPVHRECTLCPYSSTQGVFSFSSSSSDSSAITTAENINFPFLSGQVQQATNEIQKNTPGFQMSTTIFQSKENRAEIHRSAPREESLPSCHNQDERKSQLSGAAAGARPLSPPSRPVRNQNLATTTISRGTNRRIGSRKERAHKEMKGEENKNFIAGNNKRKKHGGASSGKKEEGKGKDKSNEMADSGGAGSSATKTKEVVDKKEEKTVSPIPVPPRPPPLPPTTTISCSSSSSWCGVSGSCSTPCQRSSSAVSSAGSMQTSLSAWTDSHQYHDSQQQQQLLPGLTPAYPPLHGEFPTNTAGLISAETSSFSRPMASTMRNSTTSNHNNNNSHNSRRNNKNSLVLKVSQAVSERQHEKNGTSTTPTNNGSGSTSVSTFSLLDGSSSSSLCSTLNTNHTSSSASSSSILPPPLVKTLECVVHHGQQEEKEKEEEEEEEVLALVDRHVDPYSRDPHLSLHTLSGVLHNSNSFKVNKKMREGRATTMMGSPLSRPNHHTSPRTETLDHPYPEEDENKRKKVSSSFGSTASLKKSAQRVIKKEKEGKLPLRKGTPPPLQTSFTSCSSTFSLWSENGEEEKQEDKDEEAEENHMRRAESGGVHIASHQTSRDNALRVKTLSSASHNGLNGVGVKKKEDSSVDFVPPPKSQDEEKEEDEKAALGASVAVTKTMMTQEKPFFTRTRHRRLLRSDWTSSSPGSGGTLIPASPFPYSPSAGATSSSPLPSRHRCSTHVSAIETTVRSHRHSSSGVGRHCGVDHPAQRPGALRVSPTTDTGNSGVEGDSESDDERTSNSSSRSNRRSGSRDSNRTSTTTSSWSSTSSSSRGGFVNPSPPIDSITNLVVPGSRFSFLYPSLVPWIFKEGKKGEQAFNEDMYEGSEDGGERRERIRELESVVGDGEKEKEGEKAFFVRKAEEQEEGVKEEVRVATQLLEQSSTGSTCTGGVVTGKEREKGIHIAEGTPQGASAFRRVNKSDSNVVKDVAVEKIYSSFSANWRRQKHKKKRKKREVGELKESEKESAWKKRKDNNVFKSTKETQREKRPPRGHHDRSRRRDEKATLGICSTYSHFPATHHPHDGALPTLDLPPIFIVSRLVAAAVRGLDIEIICSLFFSLALHRENFFAPFFVSPFSSFPPSKRLTRVRSPLPLLSRKAPAKSINTSPSRHFSFDHARRTSPCGSAPSPYASQKEENKELLSPSSSQRQGSQFPKVSSAEEIAKMYLDVLHESHLLLNPHDPLRAKAVLRAAEFLCHFASELASSSSSFLPWYFLHHEWCTEEDEEEEEKEEERVPESLLRDTPMEWKGGIRAEVAHEVFTCSTSSSISQKLFSQYSSALSSSSPSSISSHSIRVPAAYEAIRSSSSSTHDGQITTMGSRPRVIVPTTTTTGNNHNHGLQWRQCRSVRKVLQIVFHIVSSYLDEVSENRVVEPVYDWWRCVPCAVEESFPSPSPSSFPPYISSGTLEEICGEDKKFKKKSDRGFSDKLSTSYTTTTSSFSVSDARAGRVTGGGGGGGHSSNSSNKGGGGGGDGGGGIGLPATIRRGAKSAKTSLPPPPSSLSPLSDSSSSNSLSKKTSMDAAMPMGTTPTTLSSSTGSSLMQKRGITTVTSSSFSSPAWRIPVLTTIPSWASEEGKMEFLQTVMVLQELRSAVGWRRSEE